MDDVPTPPLGEPRLPALRPWGAVEGRPVREVVRPSSWRPPGPQLPPGNRPGGTPHRWRRLTRTRRGAAGLAILVAAVLLWPFAGWFWIPWLAGFVVLVLTALLRRGQLVDGWGWHVAGLAVVAGLMLKTGPWDWALAASLGVLLAGLVQLPWWRLAAGGAVLCLVAGTGWGVHQHRVEQEAEAQQAQSQSQSYELNQLSRPTRALPVLLRAIGRGDVGPVCSGLMADDARNSFVGATSAPDCPSAVRLLTGQVTDPAAYGLGHAPSTPLDDTLTVDACHITWSAGATPGPQLGVLTVGHVGAEKTYVVTAFRACSG